MKFLYTTEETIVTLEHQYIEAPQSMLHTLLKRLRDFELRSQGVKREARLLWAECFNDMPWNYISDVEDGFAAATIRHDPLSNIFKVKISHGFRILSDWKIHHCRATRREKGNFKRDWQGWMVCLPWAKSLANLMSHNTITKLSLCIIIIIAE
jgi:hypothetical protein